MYAKYRLLLFGASVCSEMPRSHKLLHYFKEVVNLVLKKHGTDQTIAEQGAEISYFFYSSAVTPQQYSEDLTVKSCKVAEVYVEANLNDVFIEGVNALI